MSHSQSSPPNFQDRLLLGFQRLRLSWHARRNGAVRAVRLRREADLVRLDDGSRQIYIPDARLAPRYQSGVKARLDSVAAKYLGNTDYRPRSGDTIVDIGAGIGEFTLWCADAGASVLALEPDPLAFSCLQRNIIGQPEVEALEVALWKERARLRLHGARDPDESSLIEDGKANARPIEVEAWPLDQLKAAITLPVIDFMKIDGEGVEPEILGAGLRTLRRTRVVSIDVGATGKRPNLAARVAEILDALNFRQLSHERAETILALNTAMVGPFNSRALD